MKSTKSVTKTSRNHVDLYITVELVQLRDKCTPATSAGFRTFCSTRHPPFNPTARLFFTRACAYIYSHRLTVAHLLLLQKFRRKRHTRQQVQQRLHTTSVLEQKGTREREKLCTSNPSSAMTVASGRLLRATSKAFQTDRNLPSPSTSGNTTPYCIPSLKFPFLWEAKKPPHMISRGAEQRAALITLGAASITPVKKQGVFLSESEMKSIDLLLPLAYEITRRMILRKIGAAQLALAGQCWPKIIERMIHQVTIL